MRSDHQEPGQRLDSSRIAQIAELMNVRRNEPVAAGPASAAC